jgi:hypothetical protein
MKTRQWYRARIRWAEMVEGRGIRHWEEGLYLFRSEDRNAAFRRALRSARAAKAGEKKMGAGHVGWRPGWRKWRRWTAWAVSWKTNPWRSIG